VLLPKVLQKVFQVFADRRHVVCGSLVYPPQTRRSVPCSGPFPKCPEMSQAIVQGGGTHGQKRSHASW